LYTWRRNLGESDPGDRWHVGAEFVFCTFKRSEDPEKLNTFPSMGIGLVLLAKPESSRAKGDTLNMLVRLIFGTVKYVEDDGLLRGVFPRTAI